MLFHAKFEAIARATPRHISVVDPLGAAINYEELNDRANRLAHFLIGLGLERNPLIAVHSDRSVDMIVAVLAIWKAGGAFLPLATGLPHRRREETIADADPAAILFCGAWDHAIAAGRARLVKFDAESVGIRACSNANPEVVVHPDDLAYCIYTSGSTGRPKGVAVTHAGIEPLRCAQISWFDVSEDDRVLQFASFAFDAFISELTMTLGSGAALVLRCDDVGDELVDQMVAQGVTVATFPPSLVARIDLRRAASLRALIVAGEACKATAVAAVPEGCRVVNAYGPTETTVCATAYFRRGGEDGDLPIGTAIAGTEVYLLDGNLDPVGDASIGEIYIGGRSLARGYLARPGLTAERFVPDPFAGVGRRMYRTGDLGRRRPDGNIEFAGRIDHQLKIRGYRIEGGEVENAIIACGGVRDAVVVAHEDGAGNKRLAAYLVATEEGPRSAAELDDRLRESLPEYMVPTAWTFLEALPLTDNGKVDRVALPAPGVLSRRAGNIDFACESERTLVAIWEDVLGIDGVGPHDRFVAIGGDSLCALQVSNRIKAKLGRHLTASAVLKADSLRELARWAVDAEVATTAAQEQPFEIGQSPGAERTYPAVASQLQVQYFNELFPGNNAYQAQSISRLSGPLDIARLERSIDAIVQRHEHFRSTYRVDAGGTLIGIVHDRSENHFSVVDLMHLAAEARERALWDAVDGIAAAPIDAAKLPLVRWVLFKLSDIDHALFMIEHHFVHDGWSFRVFLSEFARIYADQDADLPPPTQFREFAHYQRAWLASDAAAQARNAWGRYLEGFPRRLALPFAKHAGTSMRMQGSVVRISLPRDLVHQVDGLASHLGLTTFQVMFAVFGVLVGRYTGERRFILGTTTANRGADRFESVIGMLVNMVPVTVDLAQESPIAQSLRGIAATLATALEMGELPFNEIVAHHGENQARESLPLVQIQFSAHNALTKTVALPGIDVQVVEALSNGSAKFDLSVICIPDKDRREIELLFEYSAERYHHDAIERMAAHYAQALRMAASAPDTILDRLDYLSDEERAELLAPAIPTPLSFPADQCVHALFEAQVARTPSETAIVCGERALTYRELNQRANRLAHFLRRKGVRPEVPVALCAERSAEMVTAVLAILKAGGAYLPLDPAHPQARREFQLTDSGVRILITSSDFVHCAQGYDGDVIALEEALLQTGTQADDDLPGTTRPDNLAYTIYTSGSTGKPKGVQIEHASFVNLLGSFVTLSEIDASDRWLAITPLTFDIAGLELLLPLTTGATLVLASREQASMPEKLADLVRRRNITIMQATPSTWRMLQLSDEAIELRAAICGGEAIDESVAAYLRRVSRAAYNVYGPTETTIWSMAKDVSEGLDLGFPIANTTVRILDANLSPMPTGLIGEICIAGQGLARGYTGRAGLTAEKFLPDPYGPAGSRVYRTGDMGRRLANGAIEYLGRRDQQVKIRGHRIELGEVESALMGLKVVNDAAVIAVDDGAGGMQLEAFVVAAGAPKDATTIRDGLARLVPEYMLPSSLILLDALPLNANGKIDRNELAGRCRGSVQRQESAGAAIEMSPTLLEVIELMGAIVNGDFDGSSNLFDVGFHSINFMRLIAKCRERFGIRLSMSEVAKVRCANELAALIEAQAARKRA